jgi:putative hydrolase of the HAD superfamily
MRLLMTAPVILADADNTLWDTDAVFMAAQSRMLDCVEAETGIVVPASDRLSWLRTYDQAIASIDHRHLKYPPAMLVEALVMGLRSVTAAAAAKSLVSGASRPTLLQATRDAIVDEYIRLLRTKPALLPGVRSGLELARRGDLEVWVLTEGAADQQRQRVEHHGLASLVNGVSEVRKSTEQFDRQRKRFAPRRVFVIGDQPDRDIAPARMGGCTAILVASRFRPGWHADEAWRNAEFIADTFDLAVAWVLREVTVVTHHLAAK